MATVANVNTVCQGSLACNSYALRLEARSSLLDFDQHAEADTCRHNGNSALPERMCLSIETKQAALRTSWC